MRVVLLERVEKLGAIGDEVKVRDGFARNYLLPQKRALRATDANRKLFEARRASKSFLFASVARSAFFCGRR